MNDLNQPIDDQQPKKSIKTLPIWPALLSALVIPGAGQIFNREFQKGILLISSTLISIIWFSKVLMERLGDFLPGTPDQWARDNDLLQQGVQRFVRENPDMVVTFEILIVLIWIFGIVDAYITAKARQDPKSTSERSDTEDETDNPDN